MSNAGEKAEQSAKIKIRRPPAPPSVFLLAFAVVLSLLLIFLVAPLVQWWAQPVPKPSPYDPRIPLGMMFQQGAMNGFTLLWFFSVGASFGSFMNVVTWHMPRGMNFVSQSSICPICRHAIRGRDNLPVLGWIFLGGRCRDCGEPISFRYPLVEIFFGGAAFLLCACELASGGYNLPSSAEIYRSGFFETLWTPRWDLIAIVAVHFTLFIWLLTLCLFEIDEEAVPRRFAMLAVVLGLLVTFACPIVQPISWRLLETSLSNPSPLAAERFSGMTGLFAGAFFAIPTAFVSRTSRVYPINSILAGALVGVHLGWHAALSVVVIANLLAWINAAILGRKRGGVLTPIAFMVAATALQILSWRWLHYAQWQIGVIGTVVWLLIALVVVVLVPKTSSHQSVQ